jgi:predicted DCC family thiol-disulfide oxidoreductase YuxK
MTDRWEHELRWGPLGTLADRLVARRTVRELLETRASSFARIAEREHHGVSRRPDRLTVLYDQDCGFCTWSAETMMRIDRGHRVRFLPLAQAPALGIEVPDRDALEATIHAVDERGRWTVGGQTWITILDRVPVTRPFAWIARLPLVSRLVEPVYDRIAANRYRLSRMLRREACELPRRTS